MNDASKKSDISIIGSVGVPASYGGWETMVENVLPFFCKSNRMVVYCSSREYSQKRGKYRGAYLKYINLRANGIQSVVYDFVSMLHACKHSRIILVLGVSGGIFIPVVKQLFRDVSIIVNIDGVEWKRNKWNNIAKLFLKMSEYIAVKYSDHVVADNAAIRQYIKEQYKKNSFLIAYGGEHVLVPQASYNKEFSKLMVSQKKRDYDLTICRIEPENNIDIILSAYRELPNQRLVAIGNWNSSSYGRSLLKEYEECENVYMIGPIYNLSILAKFRSNASLYIHGHSVGGTNPSLVEAMTYGLPVVAYDVIYNRETTLSRALYFSSKTDLEEILSNNPESLEDMGLEMKEISTKLNTWREISWRYEEIFNICLRDKSEEYYHAKR